MLVHGQTKIYRKDFDGRPAYSRSVASQEYKDGQKGEWIRTYETVQMPRDTDIPDGSYIEVTAGLEAVYRSRGEVKRKLVVTGYRLLDAPRKKTDTSSAQEDMAQGFADAGDYVPF